MSKPVRYEELAQFSREEMLNEVEEAKVEAAAEWVEDLKARGLVAPNLEHELRNVHLLAQVAEQGRYRTSQTLKFFTLVIMSLSEQSGGKLVLKWTSLGEQSGVLVTLQDEPDPDHVTLQVARDDHRAGVS